MSQDDGVPQLQEGRVAQNSINGCALSFWPPKCSGLISERAGAVAELRLEILLYVHYFFFFGILWPSTAFMLDDYKRKSKLSKEKRNRLTATPAWSATRNHICNKKPCHLQMPISPPIRLRPRQASDKTRRRVPSQSLGHRPPSISESYPYHLRSRSSRNH